MKARKKPQDDRHTPSYDTQTDIQTHTDKQTYNQLND